MSSTIKLNDGTVVPWLAFGTGTALYQRSATDAAIQALSLGFTHLDTAQMYQNEDTLGEALSSSTIPRDKLYITTKLAEVPAGKTVEDTLRESLTKLKVDYVDLFLVHVPTQHLKREGGIKQVWKEMVEVKQKGLTKSIGVSNFNKAYLEEIIGLGLDVPAVNQIEYHLLLANRLAPLLEYSKSHGIITASYGGLIPIRSDDASLKPVQAKLMPVILEIANRRSASGKVTENQVLLKWLQSEGVIAVTTSSKEFRLKEYLAVEGLPDLTDGEKKELLDTIGDVQFRSFTFVPFMDVN